MTVLDLNPPQTTLRLVASSTTGSTRDHRYRDGAQLFGDARDLYREVLQAAMSWGQPIDPDALRVVLAAKQITYSSKPRYFSAATIWQLMFVDIVAWCRNRQLNVPQGCVDALTSTIAYLSASNTLDPHSEHVDELYEAIEECTGGWSDDSQASPDGHHRSLRSKRGPKRS